MRTASTSLWKRTGTSLRRTAGPDPWSLVKNMAIWRPVVINDLGSVRDIGILDNNQLAH